jgi:hypothetical protein
MGLRRESTAVTTVNGRQMTVKLIDNPNVDDIVSTEMQVQAYFVATKTSDTARKVSYDIRDYLIRLGVER